MTLFGRRQPEAPAQDEWELAYRREAAAHGETMAELGKLEGVLRLTQQEAAKHNAAWLESHGRLQAELRETKAELARMLARVTALTSERNALGVELRELKAAVSRGLYLMESGCELQSEDRIVDEVKRRL